MKTVKQIYQESKKSKQKTKIGPLSSLILDYWKTIAPGDEYQLSQNDKTLMINYWSFLSKRDKYMTNLKRNEKINLYSCIVIDEDIKLLRSLYYIGPVMKVNGYENIQRFIYDTNMTMEEGNFEYVLSEDEKNIYLRYRSSITVVGIDDKDICLTLISNHLNISLISCGFYLNKLLSDDLVRTMLEQAGAIS